MRLGEQVGYKVFDIQGNQLPIPSDSLTVNDTIQILERSSNKKLFTQVISEKEIWLWSEYGFDKNPKSSVLFKLIGNPKSCCGA